MKPSDYFPLDNDNIIVGEYEKKLIEQERQLILQHQPMRKIEEIYTQNAPATTFTRRVNGAGQLSFYRAETLVDTLVHALLSCRILSPLMGEKKDAKPELSLRFSMQVGDVRFLFARLAAVKTENGGTSCSVCAIRTDNFDEYYFESNAGTVYSGSELDIPITADDLSAATRLSKHDLQAAIRLASKLRNVDSDTQKMLKHLGASLNHFNF